MKHKHKINFQRGSMIFLSVYSSYHGNGFFSLKCEWFISFIGIVNVLRSIISYFIFLKRERGVNGGPHLYTWERSYESFYIHHVTVTRPITPIVYLLLLFDDSKPIIFKHKKKRINYRLGVIVNLSNILLSRSTHIQNI